MTLLDFVHFLCELSPRISPGKKGLEFVYLFGRCHSQALKPPPDQAKVQLEPGGFTQAKWP